MTDYSRMERHVHYYHIATWMRFGAILALVSEVWFAIKDGWPFSEDLFIALTMLIHMIGAFIQRYTKMYVSE